MNRCRDQLRALAAWVMDCVPTEYPPWSYFVLAAAIHRGVGRTGAPLSVTRP